VTRRGALAPEREELLVRAVAPIEHKRAAGAARSGRLFPA
jgi:hypothetical protein